MAVVPAAREWRAVWRGWLVLMLLAAACGLPREPRAECLDCAALDSLRAALSLLRLPARQCPDAVLQNAAALYRPFKGSMEPQAFVSMLTYLGADPRDFSPEDALTALGFIRRRSLELACDPGPQAGVDKLWQAIGLNSAARGDSPALLLERFARAGFSPASLPAELVFPVLNRSLAHTAASASALTDAESARALAAQDSAANAAAAVALTRSAMELAAVEASQQELATLTELLSAATPAPSRRPWAQIERNTKELMSGAAENLSLLSGVLALKGDRGVKGGLAGLLVHSADALLIQRSGTEGQAVALPAPGSLSGLLEQIRAKQDKAADEELEARARERLPALARLAAQTGGPDMPVAELARLLGLPSVTPFCISGFREDDPASLDRLNQSLLGRAPATSGDRTYSYLDARLSVSSIVCAVCTSPGQGTRLLVDDGSLRFVDAGEPASITLRLAASAGPDSADSAYAPLGAPAGGMAPQLADETMLELGLRLEGFTR